MAWDLDTIFEYGVPILGGLLEYDGNRRSADAAARGDAAAIAEQRRQFDYIMGLQAPYQQIGNQALNTLGRLYGYSTTPTGTAAPQSRLDAATSAYRAVDMPNQDGSRLGAFSGFASGNPIAGFGQFASQLFGSGNASSPAEQEAFARVLATQIANRGFFGDKGKEWANAPVTGSSPKPNPNPGAPGAGQPAGPLPTGLDVFTASPDYQFRRDEGMRGIENSFAARGGAASGNALRALNEFNSNLASGEFGNFFNRQAALAGIGQTATNNASSTAYGTGVNVGNLLSSQGQSRASGIAGGTNALTGTLQNLLSVWQRNRNQTPNSVYGGSW